MIKRNFFSLFISLIIIWGATISLSFGETGSDNQDSLGFEPPSGRFIVKLKDGKTLEDIKAFNRSNNIISTEKIFKKKLDRKLLLSQLKARLNTAVNNVQKKQINKQISHLEKIISRREQRKKRVPAGTKVPNLDNYYYLEADKTDDIQALIERYKQYSAVENAEPESRVEYDAIPDDPYWNYDPDSSGYNYLYGMEIISAPEAWDIMEDPYRDDVVITNIESFDIFHEDLGLEDLNFNGQLDPGEDQNDNGILDTGNVWVNQLEFNGTAGVDDDLNGCVDDFYGAYYSGGVPSNQIPASYHGTHTAGTIAAIGDNGIGVVGVNWRAKMMAACGSTEQAIYYAVEEDVDVISCSWHMLSGIDAVKAALDYAHSQGVVIVAAAGNYDSDATYITPACMDSAITVAASDHQDIKAAFSSFGVKVDVTAPGVRVGSLYYPDPDYVRMSGTSMATPHVAGLAGLIISNNNALNEIDPEAYPLLKVEEIRQIIRKSADDIVDPLGTGGYRPGFDIYSGYGRINAYEALLMNSACEANIMYPATNVLDQNYDFRDYNTYMAGFTAITGIIDIKGVANGTVGADFQSYTLEYGIGEEPSSWQFIASSTTPVSGEEGDDILYAGFDTDTLPNDTIVIRLTVTDTLGETYEDRARMNIARALITNIPSMDDEIWGGDVLFFEQSDIRGSAQGTGFEKYYLEYGVGSAPTQWIKASQDMTEPVYNGILFQNYDFSQLPEGILTLKLVTEDSVAGISEDTIVVNIDSSNFPAKDGFPIPRSDMYSYDYCSPVTADIDNNGQKEIIFGDLYSSYYDGRLRAYKSNGETLFSVPMTGVLYSSPAVGNLDADPELEIGIKALKYDIPTGTWSHVIDIFNHDGTRLEGWTPLTFPIPDYNSGEQTVVHSSPVFFDLDGDGTMEIIFGTSASSGGMLYVYHGDGTPLSGWTGGKQTADQVLITPVVGDLDQDGSPEIVTKDNTGNLSVWGSDGQLRYTRALNDGLNYFASRLGLADFDLDGTLEILTTWSKGFSIWNYDLTEFLPRIEVDNITNIYHFALGDLDNDGIPEIILPAREENAEENVYVYPIHCLKSDGTPLANWPVYADDSIMGAFPIVGDVDGDGNRELLISHANYWEKSIIGFESDGTRMTGPDWPIRKVGNANSSMVLDDLDNDGYTELIFRASYNSLRVWELPYVYNADKMDWPMYGHDACHTGMYSTVTDAPDLVIENIYIDNPVVIMGETPWTWVHFTVKNNGTADINGSRIYCTVANMTVDGEPYSRGGYMNVTITPPFKPGDTVTHMFAVAHDTSTWIPGAYRLQVMADTINEYAESNETNNLSSFIEFEAVEPATNVAPVVDSVHVTVNGQSVTVSGTAHDDDGDLALVEVMFEDNVWRAANGTDNWTLTMAGMPVGEDQVVSVRATDSTGRVSEIIEAYFTVEDPCAEYASTNAQHVAAGRAYRSFFFWVYAKGSGDYLGTYSSSSIVTVHSYNSNPGYYYSGACSD